MDEELKARLKLFEDQDKAAQELRTSHCDRADKGHECVGSCLITKEGIALACPLCGLDDRRGERNLNIHDKKAHFEIVR